MSHRGHGIAAVIGSDDLERLVDRAEDMADIPWDGVTEDLGLA
jgi:hypothetical protein